MELLIDDSVLVKKYMQGDESSLEILINRHNKRLSSFIYSKVQDREITEDIFQDTFIKVIKTLKRGKYNEEGKFLPWVMRISHNLIIDYYRKSQRMPKFETNNDYNLFSVIRDEGLSVERQWIKDQIDAELKVIIKELPVEQLEVLEMRIFKDMSFKEISENTGVSINTALGRMRYALINLRKLIDKYNIVLTN
ncbi:RNA polymerase sigma factor [Arenibacter lacus]|uniref:RNA polymerase sigma factor n=1 Tax=Arenibacter lacus TaxID=2608629 RepID=UPI00123D5AC4|nr:sigma-70 family RNA polymerase sigma factor [Arenibacter lacus]